jgi:hypothetical protein
VTFYVPERRRLRRESRPLYIIARLPAPILGTYSNFLRRCSVKKRMRDSQREAVREREKENECTQLARLVIRLSIKVVGRNSFLLCLHGNSIQIFTNFSLPRTMAHRIAHNLRSLLARALARLENYQHKSGVSLAFQGRMRNSIVFWGPHPILTASFDRFSALTLSDELMALVLSVFGTS